jgi:hypothetical protein
MPELPAVQQQQVENAAIPPCFHISSLEVLVLVISA